METRKQLLSFDGKEVLRSEEITYRPRTRNNRDPIVDMINGVFGEEESVFHKPFIQMLFEAYAACNGYSMEDICNPMCKIADYSDKMDFLSKCISDRCPSKKSKMDRL
jgi:hypothetical protein